jgi:hypothetical protein
VTLNGRNTATNYQSGAELHFEWAVNQHFPFGLAAGVSGFFYQQVTDDHGSGAQLGAFRGRVAAVGPLLSYALKAGAQEVDFRLAPGGFMSSLPKTGSPATSSTRSTRASVSGFRACPEKVARLVRLL